MWSHLTKFVAASLYLNFHMQAFLCSSFMPTSMGHPLGCDVLDVGGYPEVSRHLMLLYCIKGECSYTRAYSKRGGGGAQDTELKCSNHVCV